MPHDKSKKYLRIQPKNKRALYSDILQAVLCQNISLPRFCINLLQHRNWMLMVTNRIAFAFVQVKGSNPQTIQSSGRGKCNCFYAYIRVPIKILIYKVVISDPHVVSLFGSSIIKNSDQMWGGGEFQLDISYLVARVQCTCYIDIIV